MSWRVVWPFHWLTDNCTASSRSCACANSDSKLPKPKATTSKVASSWKILSFKWVLPAPIERAPSTLKLRTRKTGFLLSMPKGLKRSKLFKVSSVSSVRCSSSSMSKLDLLLRSISCSAMKSVRAWDKAGSWSTSSVIPAAPACPPKAIKRDR